MSAVSVAMAVHRSTPHPVPLPKGEGTKDRLDLIANRVLDWSPAFLLPWGEGQDEGLLTALSDQQAVVLPWPGGMIEI